MEVVEEVGFPPIYRPPFTLNLCESMRELPEGDEWIFEQKLDGIRCMSLQGVLRNRKSATNQLNRSISDNFPEIEPLANAVLDGEVVSSNVYEVVGRANLDDRFRINLLSKLNPARFVVFDILELDGVDLRGIPLLERRKILEEAGELGKNVELIQQYEDGKRLWQEVGEKGGEGVVAKRKNSPYAGKRTWDWIKVKHFKEVVVPITRYEFTGAGGFVIFVQLENGEEQKVVVNSIDLQSRIVKNPDLKAEIQFLEISKNGKLRHPSIKRLIFNPHREEVKELEETNR